MKSTKKKPKAPHLSVATTAAQLRAWEMAAMKSNRSLSNWVRVSLDRAILEDDKLRRPYLYEDPRCTATPVTRREWEQSAAKNEHNFEAQRAALPLSIHLALAEVEIVRDALYRRMNELHTLAGNVKQASGSETAITSLVEQAADVGHTLDALPPTTPTQKQTTMRESHCVFPQPGCDVNALPLLWRERAATILTEWVEDGPKYQGCCVRNGAHVLLKPAEVAKLTLAGFLVEKDSEPNEE